MGFIIYRTLSTIASVGGLVMMGVGGWYDFQQSLATPTGPFGLSILLWGVIVYTIGSILIIGQLWWRIHKIESPIKTIIKVLKRNRIRNITLLEIFDALTDQFAIGLSYSQIHDVLKNKLDKNAAWGNWSSDIIAGLTTLGLIYPTSTDPNYPTSTDGKRTITNYVYQLTDNGGQVAQKLMNQEPKIGKGDSQKK